MASSNQGTGLPHWSSGRCRGSMDPERQGEVVGYVVRGPIQSAPTPRTPSGRGRTKRTDWMCVQPDPDSSNFEGSSSRRGR